MIAFRVNGSFLD